MGMMKRLGALLVSLLIAAVPASAQQTPTNATVSTVDKAQRVVCVNPTSHALESWRAPAAVEAGAAPSTRARRLQRATRRHGR